MQKPLLGEKLAVLVANGFCEQDLTQAQRVLLSAGVDMRIISMDNGLVNSWSGENWGLNFAADKMLSEALAVDYGMLLVPGGKRSIEKLKLTAHTRRFVNGFLNAGKPVVMCGDAVELLDFAGVASEYSAADPQDEGYVVDRHLMSGASTDENREDFCQAMASYLIQQVEANAEPASVAA